MTNSESVYTHDLPPGDIAALLERLRRVDGVRYDCTILVWEQCQALTQELDRREASREFCHRWYAERWERLRKLIHDDARHIEDEACRVMANGTADVDEVPTYAQLLSRKDMDIGRLTLENDRLRNLVEGLSARVAAQAELLGKRAERGEL